MNADASCGLLLVINADGSVSVLQDPSQGPYDQVEDTLVGVQNNSSASVPSLTLTGTNPALAPFGFDGDGEATYTGTSYGSTGYEGPNTSFSNISSDWTSGEVDFTGGLGAGSSAWFTLEGAVSATDLTIIPSTPVNTPPVCSGATPSTATLWAPNHKLVPISINGVTDADAGESVTLAVATVTQDERTNGLGDGDTPRDAVINADGTVLLRAERSGTGDGRVYVITFTATDTHGATCTGSVSVSVPHDQGKGSTAVNSGQKYDSTL